MRRFATLLAWSALWFEHITDAATCPASNLTVLAQFRSGFTNLTDAPPFPCDAASAGYEAMSPDTNRGDFETEILDCFLARTTEVQGCDNITELGFPESNSTAICSKVLSFFMECD